MCAAVYRQVDQSLPQGISGRFHAPDLRRTDWQALADDIGLSGASTLKRVEELAKLVSNACDEVAPYIVPHSIATIQEVWDQQVKVSGRAGEPLFEPHYETFSFGTIVFERQQKGITHSCMQTVRLGRPKDKYMAGEKLDVVPATGTCDRVDVIGRLPEQ